MLSQRNIFFRSLIFLVLFFEASGSIAQSSGSADTTVVKDTVGISNISKVDKKEKSAKSNDSSIKNSLVKREIYVKHGRTSFKFKYGARIQTRFDLVRNQEPGATAEGKLYFRRVRFKSDGYLFNPKIGYKLEIDIIGTQILDAYLKWNFYKNLEVWAGQTKLRGNRERVISSQNLQLVDRSLLNSKFTLDRDIGVFLFNHFQAGKSVFRQAASVSQGEGLSLWQGNPLSIDKGLDYTARLEFLPLGNFKNKGDYVESDLEREDTPKVSVGMSYDFNKNALKSRGQKGGIADIDADLRSWIIDMMFKYRGFSLMSEWVDRKVHDFKHQTVRDYYDYVHNFYTGNAFNIQSGYVFKSNYEIAARYTQVRPQSGSIFNDLTEYTIGLSKYIVGHKIKSQTDYSIRQERSKPTEQIYRLQFELSL